CGVTGGSAIRGDHSNTIAILVFCWELYRLFQSFSANHGQYWAKNFIGVNRHFRSNVVKECGASKESTRQRFSLIVGIRHVERTAIGKQFCSGINSLLDIAFYPVLSILGN